MITEFKDLLGEIVIGFLGLEVGSDCIDIVLSNGKAFRFWHDQECCETVTVEDMVGNPEDILNSPLVFAEEVTEIPGNDPDHESGQWTFYKFATKKGYLTIKWAGYSDYYSTSVSFAPIDAPPIEFFNPPLVIQDCEFEKEPKKNNSKITSYTNIFLD